MWVCCAFYVGSLFKNMRIFLRLSVCFFLFLFVFFCFSRMFFLFLFVFFCFFLFSVCAYFSYYWFFVAGSCALLDAQVLMVGSKACICYFKFGNPNSKKKKTPTQEKPDAEMKNNYPSRILGKLIWEKLSQSMTQTQSKFAVISCVPVRIFCSVALFCSWRSSHLLGNMKGNLLWGVSGGN